MQITPLSAGHADSVIALWRTCGLTRPWNDPSADLDRALAGPASTVLTAVDAGAVVGTVMVGHDGHRGWVYYLAVAPTAQHRGIGRSLMDAAEDWLKRRAVPKVQLMVRSENAQALGFYDRLGYVPQDVVVLGRFLDSGTGELREDGQRPSAVDS